MQTTILSQHGFMITLVITITFFVIGVIVFIFYRLKIRQQISLSKILNSALQSMGYGFLLYDKNGHYLRSNTLAMQILPVQDIISRNNTLSCLIEYIYDRAIDYDDALKSVIDNTLQYAPMADLAFRDVLLTEQGDLCLVMVCEDKSGCTLVLVLNITNQFGHEKQYKFMSKENHRLLHAIEFSKVGIIISDAKTNGNPIIFANSAMSVITDKSRLQLMKSYWIDLLELFEVKNDRSAIEKAFEKNDSFETNLVRKINGIRFFYNLTISPVLDKAKAVEYYIGTFTDVSALKMREAEFFRAQKLEALGQLSAGVAHDFNNILSIIDGYAILAEKKLPHDAAVASEYISRILVASQRGSALTKRMVMFGANKLGDYNIYELGKIVRDQEILLHGALEARGIKLFLDIGAEEIFVKCAPDSISQILMNMVINARDAIQGDSGIISIKVAIIDAENIKPIFSVGTIRTGVYAMLSVVDSGIGMDEETIPRIFDPFFTTKEKDKGTGLGLSVVYGLVHEINGLIDVKSEIGRGTNITIYIPLAEPADNIYAMPSQNKEPHSLDGITALVVDNEPDIVQIITTILKDSGMVVLPATSGDEALLQQDNFRGKIDVLITDIFMPDMNGIKLAELMHSLRPEIKTIFVSAFSPDDKSHKLQIPKDAPFIPKPLNPNEIKAALYKMLVDEPLTKVGSAEKRHSRGQNV